jgi:outer membrane protein
VYVDNIKVFNSFLMTKEMKTSGEKELNTRTKSLDSLYQALDNTADPDKKQLLVKQIIAKKDFIENFQQNYPEEESVKIWNRIKAYGENFAKEKNYKLVLGMHPDMNIIYGEDSMNVSDEFIIYINSKYEGK